MTPEQVDLVANSIDTEEDGMIDYEEFLNSFVIVDILATRSTREAPSSSDYSGTGTNEVEEALLALAAQQQRDSVSSSSSSSGDEMQDTDKEDCHSDDSDGGQEGDGQMGIDEGNRNFILDRMQNRRDIQFESSMKQVVVESEEFVKFDCEKARISSGKRIGRSKNI